MSIPDELLGWFEEHCENPVSTLCTIVAISLFGVLVTSSCTGPQLRATLASIEVGYAQTRSDADVGGHVGTPSLTGDAFRGDVDSGGVDELGIVPSVPGLYMPEQEILEHLRPPPPRERCGDVCPTCKKGLD